MADDFGDYSGEKLFDWMLRIGQNAGGAAALSAADRFRQALVNARSASGSDGQAAGAADGPLREKEQWAKLDMHEFTAIEDWPTLQEVIAEKLRDCGIDHEWYRDEADRTFLLFRADDAPSMVRAFDELIQQTDAAKDRASRELVENYSLSRDRALEMKQAREQREQPFGHAGRTGSDERLKDKADKARAAANEMRKHDHGGQERARRAEREKAQGR